MRNEQRENLCSVFARGELIKICGLREPEHAIVAAEAGADMLSFIFALSRRQVTAATVRACIDAARSVPRSIPFLAVGVFVDADPATVEQTAGEAGLDLVQLSGRESIEYIDALSVPAIKAFQPRPEAGSDDVLDRMRSYLDPVHGALAALIDGFHPTAKGGTGIRADWQLVAEVCARQPVLLAGGLDPGNVAEAIDTVHPLGVDVSGGVERDGVKDSDRIEAFIRAARDAFRSSRTTC
jgi:phosphoribosylanthranilate isomerase